MPLPDPIRHKDALRFTTAVATRLFEIEKASEGQVKIVRSAKELRKCLRDGTFAAILHIEGAEAIDTNYDALHILHAAGLRSWDWSGAAPPSLATASRSASQIA